MKEDYVGVNYTGINAEPKTCNEIYVKPKLDSGKKDLLEYEIQQWEVFIDNSGDMSVAEVKIVFRR